MVRVDLVLLAVALAVAVPTEVHGHAGYSRGPRIPTPYQSLAAPRSAAVDDGPAPGPALKTRRAFFPDAEEDDGDNHHDGHHGGGNDDDVDGPLGRPRDARRLPGGSHDQEALLLGLLAHRRGNGSGSGLAAADNPRGVQGSLMDMLSKSE